jgi:hypothetical protein
VLVNPVERLPGLAGQGLERTQPCIDLPRNIASAGWCVLPDEDIADTGVYFKPGDWGRPAPIAGTENGTGGSLARSLYSS